MTQKNIPHSIEVKIEKSVFNRKENWVTEVSPIQISEYLGSNIRSKFDTALTKNGWNTIYRIDALLPEPLIFLELKVSKLDKIWGERGGKCLWDIGPWAKDLNRLLLLKKICPNAKCYFILIGLHKEKHLPNPKATFFQKLETEFKNDINRDKGSELNQNHLFRKKQRLILEKLISVKRSRVIAMKWEHISVIGINIESLL